MLYLLQADTDSHKAEIARKLIKSDVTDRFTDMLSITFVMFPHYNKIQFPSAFSRGSTVVCFHIHGFMVVPRMSCAFLQGPTLSVGLLKLQQRWGAGAEGGMPTGRTMLNAPLFRFRFRDDSSVMWAPRQHHLSQMVQWHWGRELEGMSR